MTNKKANVLMILGLFVLIGMIGGLTVAFFNYTRTGSANTITTGGVYFNTGQTNTINLTNVFPIASADVATDNANSSEVIITVTGDTTYTQGMEYLVTAEDVTNIVGTGNNSKAIPISVIITPEKTGDLGTEATNYWTQRGGNTSYYKTLAKSNVTNGQQLLVGYIKPDSTGVNGTIGIRAYLDKSKITISDTYSPVVRNGENGWGLYATDENGTTSEWVDRRTVLTTTEWNNLQSTPLSFKVKIEANEGIWVDTRTFESSDVTVSYADYEYNIVANSGDIRVELSAAIDGETGYIRIDDGTSVKKYNEATSNYDDITNSWIYDTIILRFLPENFENRIDEPLTIEISYSDDYEIYVGGYTNIFYTEFNKLVSE